MCSTTSASDNAFQLASVRSVETIFPLKGSLQLKTANDSDAEINYKPQQGEVWVDSRLFSKLKILIGDKVEVGVAEFIVTGLIESEPGRGTVFTINFPLHMQKLKLLLPPKK